MSGQIPGTTVSVDPEFGTEVHNTTDIPTADVYNSLTEGQRQLMAAMGQWSNTARGGGRRGNLFHRDRFVTPDSVFAQMEAAYDAVENDDIVAGVLESTESLAFSKMSFYADDTDEQEIYNQIAEQIDLDSRLREMWRELFTVSQFYCGIWWENRDFKLRGSNRKKTYANLRVPSALTILDPLKVVPVGMTMFNRERLCWIADRSEQDTLNDPLKRAIDPIMSRFILGKYEPTQAERKWLGDLNVDPFALYEINPMNVFRHTATRPQYQRFASVRMKSVFPLLDLKENLRAMDRAHLIGGTNFIVLITQGSDDHPAKPEEIMHLQSSVKVVAQTPVLVGDHRLDVKIITPKMDATLDNKRYDTVDSRIQSRLYQMFVRSGGGERTDKGTDMMKVVASGMESRRKMLRRAIEAHVLNPMWDANQDLKSRPKLEFHPKQIALDFSADMASFMLDLRESREISRHTILNQFGFSQEFEAELLEREKEEFDEIFQTINPNNQGQPGSPVGPDEEGKPSQTDPKRAGRRRGGAAPGSGQGKAPRGRPKEGS